MADEPPETKQERHARKYQQSQIRALILQRYARSHPGQSRKKLLQHTCHACAWVTHLPADVAAGIVGVQDLSPVRVLTRMLRRRGSGPLTPRLRTALGQVRDRLDEVLAGGITGVACVDWKELCRVMPRSFCPGAQSVPDEQCELPAIDVVGSEHRQQKLLERFSNEHCRFRNSCRQAEDVEALLKEALEAHESGDALQMCHLLFKGVSWLAKPRLKSDETPGCEMTKAAKQELRMALQTKLRSAIMFCLRGLDLQDVGTRQRGDVQVSVNTLRKLLERVDLEKTMSRKQWRRIAQLIECSDGHGNHHEHDDNDQAESVVETRRNPDPRIQKNVGIFEVMKLALRRLGGQATSTELKQEIRNMPEARNLGTEKSFGRSTYIWEHTVVRNTNRLFDPAYDGEGVILRRAGQKLWKLRKV